MMLIVLIAALVTVHQFAFAIQYVNSVNQWTVYLNDYSLVNVANVGNSVQLSSTDKSYVAVQVMYKGEPFVPENFPSKFTDTFTWYAHVHSDPCEDNKGNHWKADQLVTTAVESNEFWFLHSAAANPYFAREQTAASHALPGTIDRNIVSLTIHEPKINGTAAKIGCIPLTPVTLRTEAPTTTTGKNYNIDEGTAADPTTFIVLVVLICLGGTFGLFML